MIFSFDDSELDEGLYQLRKRGKVVRLAPKAFDLLLYLIRHRDRVVSKSELLDELWPGEHVTEAVLPSHMAAVRKALQSRSRRSRSDWIQTVRGRGYRFVAEVEEREGAVDSVGEGALFVGREDVMQGLRADLEEAFAHRGRLVMLVGEPGIGKTRTAEELANEARRKGALVAEGRCYEGEGVPAFWPWIQILRTLVAERPVARLREQLGPGASDIALLVPELRRRFPNLPEPDAVESEQARFRLFDSVSTFFHNTSRDRALVLFVDDLHWADEPTLRLMQFLVREMRDARVALLGAYRDEELRRQHPLARMLGLLAREPHFRRIRLRGLVESDVSRFIEGTAGRRTSDALVRTVFEMTEGNPLFIHETVRILDAEGRLDADARETPLTVGLPQGVREVIGRNLDRLSQECNRVLRVAAVIGREFSVGLLERAAEVSRELLLQLLEEAVEARIVGDQTGTGSGAAPLPLGHYTFTHALIREVLYEELTGPQRVRLHRKVAEELEASCGLAIDAHLPELAQHFFEAAPGGDVERAIDYGVRAAERALGQLAWEESVARYQRVLEVEELAIPADPARRGELIIGLAQALWRSGSYSRSRETFHQVIDIARQLGDERMLTRAILGMGGWPKFRADEPPGGPADEYRALLEEALECVDEAESALRARLLSLLAEQISMDSRESYSQRAVVLARESGDPEALFGALYSRLAALLGPDDIQRRLEVATELLDLAIRLGSKEKVFVARESRIRSLMALGDIAGMDREIDSCHELAEELRIPIYRHSLSRFRMARALGDGRLDEAERLNREILALGRKADDGNAELLYAMLTGWLCYLRGDLSSTRELIEGLLQRVAFIGPIALAFAAFLHAELEEPEPARQHFERLAAAGFTDVPRDEGWLMTLGVAAEVCAHLGDRSRAETLYALLVPYADLPVSHQHMRVYLEPVEHALGRLAETRGEREAAAAHYQAAIESSQRIGARPQLARSQRAYGRMLLEPEAVSRAERELGAQLLARAETSARALGMKRLLEGVGREDRGRLQGRRR